MPRISRAFAGNVTWKQSLLLRTSKFAMQCNRRRLVQRLGGKCIFHTFFVNDLWNALIGNCERQSIFSFFFIWKKRRSKISRKIALAFPSSGRNKCVRGEGERDRNWTKWTTLRLFNKFSSTYLCGCALILIINMKIYRNLQRLNDTNIQFNTRRVLHSHRMLVMRSTRDTI